MSVTDKDADAPAGEEALEPRPQLQLWPLVVVYGLAFAWALFVALMYHLGESLGICASCDVFKGSVFSSVLGLPLEMLGVFAMAIPLWLLSRVYRIRREELVIERSSGRGADLLRTSQRKLIVWRVFLIYIYLILGVEIYLCYAQVLLGRLCILCSVQAILVFACAGAAYYQDRAYSLWQLTTFSDFATPRWILVLLGLLGFHFIQHPTGSFTWMDSVLMKERIQKTRIRESLMSQVYAKPYEVAPYGKIHHKEIRVLEDGELKNISEKIDQRSRVRPLGELEMAPEAMAMVGRGQTAVMIESTEMAVEKYSRQYLNDTRSEGDPNAPVRLIVYTNYGCPACCLFERDQMPEIRKNSIETGKPFVQYRFYYMQKLPFSDTTAIVSSCAAMQGSSTWHEVHARLFESVDEWAKDGNIKAHVGDLVDMEKLNSCIVEWDELEDNLIKDYQEAESRGVDRLPSFAVYLKGRTEPERVISGSVSGPIIVELVDRFIQ
ncbi:MAG: thioredoxin domain-containing protein [Planctomycetes bacterium]|nr:thioredoxin domain-containing protein [Planctomycetota bacterium]